MLQGTNLATEDDPEPPGSGSQAYTVYEQVVGIFNKEKALEGSFSKHHEILMTPAQVDLLVAAPHSETSTSLVSSGSSVEATVARTQYTQLGTPGRPPGPGHCQYELDREVYEGHEV